MAINPSPRYILSGRITNPQGEPLEKLVVRAFDQDPKSPDNPLGQAVTDAEGNYAIQFSEKDFKIGGVESGGPDVYIRVDDDSGALLGKSAVQRNSGNRITINLQVDYVASETRTRGVLEGHIVLEHGLPAEKVTVRLYHLGFGGAATLVGETLTGEQGRYSLPYSLRGKVTGLEVRTVGAHDNEIPLSKPIYDRDSAGPTEINLVAPASLQPLAAEYRRLSADLTLHVGAMAKLAEARENEDRQDLTVLNRATGWDARLIALAAMTERLSADPEVKLPREGLYGLLRAGLPSDKLLLAQVEPDVAEQALKTARDAGIVALSDSEIGAFRKEFAAFGNKVRLNIPAPGSRSTYGALLKASGLPQEAQDKFGPVYLNHRGDTAQLWDEARKVGLNNEQIGKLKLQGKLAFLAGNSEAMTARLLQKQVNDPAQLVDQDFHRAETWLDEVFDQAGIPANRRANLTDADRKKLDELIPIAYAGEKVEDRLHAYAEDMARKVRLSYPTQVVGRLLESDDKFKLPAAHDATVTLLKKAAEQGFRLGETPVAAFLKTKTEVTAGMADPGIQAAKQQLQALQCVYQITPSNEAMPVMISLGMTYAYDVTAYTEAEFVALFEAKYKEIHKKPAPAGLAEMISRKAKQVSSVTYNLFTIAKKLESEPPIAGLSAPVEVRESVRSELIKQFPTLESLFGSMDFCECEHCRSVLSPAAYLVDLLQFVDPEPGVWGNFLAHWKATHNNQNYPHKNASGDAMKPYDVLIERRPDLPHIPLTCENTHTALPYIDIVNEILEYYVAHGKLEEKAARDTGDATTAELLAEPQNVIREAYDKLREERYPLNLPFDPWIETVRQFCNYFETPLDRLLETFRESDALFASSQPFDRADIFMESLGLSPAEVALFTDSNPLSKWHELYGFGTAAQATIEATDATTGQRIDLNSAKALSRRLGITYKELAEIVQTGFVNPKLTHLHLLYKLGVGIHDARFYLDHKNDPAPVSVEEQKQQLEVQAFAQELAKLATAFDVTTAYLEAELQAIPFSEILVLADTDAACNFDLTTLQYADGKKADPMAFLRINLFVRLWRKLGWSIEETDRALSTFVPQPALVDAAKLPGWLKTALIYLAHLKALDEKLRVGKQSRLKLLTLWSDIVTTGKKPLYAQLFLSRSVLKSAPVFDHPLGRYLSDPNVKLKDHVLALQGALGLTADEISAILAEAGKSLDTAALSLPNVSLLYRYSLLAKALKLSVRELIALKQLSGLDPFKPLHPDPLTAIEDDHPFSQILRFVEIAEEVKESGLKIEDLDYLLRHRFDETGKYRSNREGTLALLKTLAGGIRAIRAEHAVPDDPGAMSEEVLRQKLGLVLPPDVVERFLAMMNGTVEFTAAKSGVAAADQLVPAGFADEPAIREVRYNAARQEQKLTFRGVLFDAEKTALKARLPKPTPPNPHVPSSILGDLLDDVQQQARSFFEKYLQKQAPGINPATGFLETADFDLLFAPMPSGMTGAQQQARYRQQRTRLAQAFFPYLQQRLIRQFVVQMMTAHTGADSMLAESLMTDERLLAAAGSKPLLTPISATGERGVSVAFFDSDDLSGAAQAAKAIVGSTDTSLKAALDPAAGPLPPANSARFEGYLEVPASGAYRFYVELDKQNAEAELRFEHLPNPVFLSGSAAADNATLGEQPNEFLELKPGIPYRFSLELKKLNGGGARLLAQGETLPKEGLSRLTLYPLSAMAGAESAVLLLAKALQLVQALGLSEREIRYLLTHSADFGGVDLSELPTLAVGDTSAEKAATTERFTRFLRLAAYARLKRDLAVGTDDLIAIFEANGSGDLDNVYSLIAKLTRRDDATVKVSAEALAATPGFASEKPLLRLWEALQVVERFGVPVASLQAWTHIVGTGVTPGQRFETARDLKEAIKARFEPEAWQRVAQPIFDRLRQRQRDALVSYVMHQRGFARMEQLYEYFLIDPGMEPVVQTSRIRLAIASVQLFIQRCLLNLEPKVHPSTINSKHWEWMKRYRVWEANRKIFLFPENWLEPEFRDDKTHLFAELEGALLQGDVSSDLVEDAFLNYLKKLDELARLDIVAMHIEDDPDPARRTLHVFGRTYSQPHKFFYRRYAHQMWTPWEPVSTEIEGDHLAPVVWRDRLYLFWVTFVEKASQSSGGMTIDPAKPLTLPAVKKDVEVHLHWSEYLQGEWNARESNGFGTPDAIIATGLSSFDSKSVFIHVSKADKDGEERGVYIHLGNPINRAFFLAGRNSAPENKGYSENNPQGAKPTNAYSSANSVRANRYTGSGAFKVRFQERLTTEPGKTPPPANPSILQQGDAYTLLPCDNNLAALGVSAEASQGAANPAAVEAALKSGIGEIASLIKPVFYQDNRHTFFVEPNVTERTIEEWQEWVTRTPQPEPDWRIPDWWKDIVVIPETPWKPPIPDPRGPRFGFDIDKRSLINPIPDHDWLVNPITMLKFDDALVGPAGQPGLQISTEEVAETTPVHVNPGSGLAAGSVVVANTTTLEQSGLIQAAGGLNVVDSAGFNSALAKNFNELNRMDFSAGMGTAGRFGS